MKPLVSVITLTYKKYDHLFDTIKSVCGQDYDQIEYIICDDGSGNFPKDDVIRCIEENKGPNMRAYYVYANEVNVGTVRNINFAYHHAHGDYFINLSCGDLFFERDTLSKVMNRLLLSGNEMIVTTRLMYSGNYEPLFLLPHYADLEMYTALTTKEDQYRVFIMSRLYEMASGSVMCMSRKAIEEIGYFDETYFFWEDGPFLAKYLLRFKLECAPDIVSIWYEQGGISTDGEKKLYPRLQKDTMQFNSTERVAHLDRFTAKERRWIRFRNERLALGDSKKKYLLYIKYLPEAIRQMKHKEKRSENYEADLAVIKKLMEYRQPFIV